MDEKESAGTLSSAEKVESRSGSGRQARNASRALKSRMKRGPRRIDTDYVPQVVAQSEIASDNVLEQPDGLALNQLADHITENCTYSIEPFIRMADIRQAGFIQQDFLHNEYGDSLGEF